MIASSVNVNGVAARKLVVKAAEGPYTVAFVNGDLRALHDNYIGELTGERPQLLVVDARASSYHGMLIRSYIDAHPAVVDTLYFRGGESMKTLDSVTAICDRALQIRFPRDGIIVGIGGGALLDTAGFAASMYRRGVGFIRVPTTLVGLVDVSVGIKHAVNFGGQKNSLGAFHPPLGSIVDRIFLTSLPDAHIASGLAEIIKLGLVCDATLFEMIETFGSLLLHSRLQHPPKLADDLVFHAAETMARELEPNLYERKLRRLPDFGHTFSPMIEVETRLPHGHAVALDMLISLTIAMGRGWCDRELLLRLLRLYRELQLPVGNKCLDVSFLESAAEQTKAHRAGSLHLVVPCAIGSGTFIEDLERGELQRAATLLRHSRRQLECAS